MGKTTIIKKMQAEPKNNTLPIYRDRINNYYEAEYKKYALAILDVLATESALSFSDIWNRLALEQPNKDRETALDVLKLLLKDYYLIQEDKTYSFRYQIVKNYWELLRGL